MATMKVDGFEFQEKRFAKMGPTMIRKIVEAGAGAAEKIMANETKARGHVRTGDMLESIGNNGIREYLGGASTEVYPQGEDRLGTRNATKAYVINYGKGLRPNARRPKGNPKRNLTGDKFITGNEQKTEDAVVQAMQAESDRLIAEI